MSAVKAEVEVKGCFHCPNALFRYDVIRTKTADGKPFTKHNPVNVCKLDGLWLVPSTRTMFTIPHDCKLRKQSTP